MCCTATGGLDLRGTTGASLCHAGTLALLSPVGGAFGDHLSSRDCALDVDECVQVSTKPTFYLAVCQNLVPLVNIKIAGKWMFIPLKMVLIGIDPYPFGSENEPPPPPKSNLYEFIWAKHEQIFRRYRFSLIVDNGSNIHSPTKNAGALCFPPNILIVLEMILEYEPLSDYQVPV